MFKFNKFHKFANSVPSRTIKTIKLIPEADWNREINRERAQNYYINSSLLKCVSLNINLLLEDIFQLQQCFTGQNNKESKNLEYHELIKL